MPSYRPLADAPTKPAFSISARGQLWLRSLMYVPLLLILSACSGGKAAATPTLGLEAIATSAYQTFTAEMATKQANATPTNTVAPSPSPFPTFAIGSPLPTLAFASSTPLVAGPSDCDDASYMADVTIPDGTVLGPGEHFTKTWKLLNSGTCAWNTKYKLVFDSGDMLDGATTFAPLAVPVGSEVDMAVGMIAPFSSGSYKGKWQMQNDKNQPFGSIVYVQIQVGGNADIVAGPTSSTGSVTISGNAGSDGVNLDYSGTKGGNGTVVSDANGNYTITVASGWSGTITPHKGKHTFDPPSLSFPNVYSNQTDQDFKYH